MLLAQHVHQVTVKVSIPGRITGVYDFCEAKWQRFAKGAFSIALNLP